MAALWMILASLLFACMGACVKLGSDHLNAAELVFWRGFVALLLIGTYVVLTRRSVRSPHWRDHLARSLSGFLALVCYFLAIIKLPLATAVTLNYTSPLWLAVLLSVHSRERHAGVVWLALFGGLAGVALLLKPDLGVPVWPGAFFGLCSGALSAVAYHNVKRLGLAGEPEWRTVFWFSAVCALGGLPAALGNPHHGGWSVHDVLVVLGVGGFGLFAQLAMTRAYSLGRTLATAALSYATVIFAALFGALVFGSYLDLHAALGIAVIAGAGLVANRAAPSRQLPEPD